TPHKESWFDCRYNLAEMSATDKVSTCRVCYNSTSEYPSTSDSCDHEHSICSACVVKHIRSEIFKGNVVNIVCPSANCEVVLGYCDIKRLIPRDLFERYGLFLLRHVIRQLEDFRWCKRQGCGWGQEHSSGDEAPIMTCHACKFKTCYTCDVPWHEGITCEEFKQRMEDDPHGAANNAYHDRHTKQCPKCKWPIEKK
ncbi:17939_t:CDS:2, partial [Racocetra persica]